MLGNNFDPLLAKDVLVFALDCLRVLLQVAETVSSSGHNFLIEQYHLINTYMIFIILLLIGHQFLPILEHFNFTTTWSKLRQLITRRSW
jgi:hypothetical protein